MVEIDKMAMMAFFAWLYAIYGHEENEKCRSSVEIGIEKYAMVQKQWQKQIDSQIMTIFFVYFPFLAKKCPIIGNHFQWVFRAPI